ncbi:MAG TPA: hypothetical protein VG144_09745, partial [Gaiellaceae bacterium]|nr:hypothetical protein [Gaiellaceae bacterium]
MIDIVGLDRRADGGVEGQGEQARTNRGRRVTNRAPSLSPRRAPTVNHERIRSRGHDENGAAAIRSAIPPAIALDAQQFGF